MMDATATIPIEISLAPSKRSVAQVLVLGLGNTLLGDDGVGVHVVRRLSMDDHAPAGLRPLDGGTLGFRLMAELAQCDAVLIVDAAELSQPAGSIRLLSDDALAKHVRRAGRLSAHEAGLADLLTLARLEGWSPRRLALIGIQPQRIDWDERLSDDVALSVSKACRLAVDTVLAWQHAA